MASHFPQPLLDRLAKARQLLGDPASGLAGNREVARFVESLELQQRLHELLLDDEGEARRAVSLLDKKKVRGAKGRMPTHTPTTAAAAATAASSNAGRPPPTRLLPAAGAGCLRPHPLPERHCGGHAA